MRGPAGHGRGPRRGPFRPRNGPLLAQQLGGQRGFGGRVVGPAAAQPVARVRADEQRVDDEQ
ncbi:hypothetical protein, partial [Streptomyces griseus]|uniref:hypothetical protein n=1 Tax=Streptomyces griseus TaxID=1911 RepID=UPI0036B28EE6